jgi:hypothetical protein
MKSSEPGTRNTNTGAWKYKNILLNPIAKTLLEMTHKKARYIKSAGRFAFRDFKILLF